MNGGQWLRTGIGIQEKSYIIKAVGAKAFASTTGYIDLYNFHGGTSGSLEENWRAFEILRCKVRFEPLAFSSHSTQCDPGSIIGKATCHDHDAVPIRWIEDPRKTLFRQ